MLAPARGLRWKECMACCGPTLQIGAIHLSNPCQHHNELREKKKRENMEEISFSVWNW